MYISKVGIIDKPNQRRFDHEFAANLYASEPDLSMRDLAAMFAVSHEAIRLAVLDHRPDARESRRAIAAERKRRALEAQVEVAPRCVVCHGPNLRAMRGKGKSITCSHRCAKLWLKARLWLDPEQKRRHRLAWARSNLRTGRNVELAVKVISRRGEMISPERSKPVIGSESYRAYLEALKLREENGG
jgi:hypothetical protein